MQPKEGASKTTSKATGNKPNVGAAGREIAPVISCHAKWHNERRTGLDDESRAAADGSTASCNSSGRAGGPALSRTRKSFQRKCHHRAVPCRAELLKLLWCHTRPISTFLRSIFCSRWEAAKSWFSSQELHAAAKPAAPATELVSTNTKHLEVELRAFKTTSPVTLLGTRPSSCKPLPHAALLRRRHGAIVADDTGLQRRRRPHLLEQLHRQRPRLLAEF